MKKLLVIFAILGVVVSGCKTLSGEQVAGPGDNAPRVAEKDVAATVDEKPAPPVEEKPAPPIEEKPAPPEKKEAAPPEKKEATNSEPDVEKATPPDTPELKDEESRFSYSYGFNIGQSLKFQQAEVDSAGLLQGLNDGLSGAEPLIDRREIRQIVMDFHKKARARQGQTRVQRNSEAAKKNKEAGAAFLAENAKKEGVKTVESGLQYRVIKAGDGPSPKKTDKVVVHYRGTTIDGDEFDSSYKRGKPTTFPVNGVIPGFSEALQMMKPGDKWEIFIPGEIAYADLEPTGPGGPFATLIFELELIGIEPGQ